MVGRSTRKNRKTSKALKTVPEIRKSLDQIDEDLNKSLQSNLSLEDKINNFTKLWKAKIGKIIPHKMAKDYIELRMRAKKSRSMKQTRRRQRGGMAPLAGAALDSTTRPGIYGYGTNVNSLPYVNNDIRGFWSSGISADCGKVDITPRIPVDIGSNRVSGGGITTLMGAPLEAGFRFPMTTPPSLANDVSANINGRLIPGTTPDPTRNYIPSTGAQQGTGLTNITSLP